MHQTCGEPDRTIRLITEIQAPIKRCFDLSRSIDLHLNSLAGTGEKAVAGVTTGLISLGEQVTWVARHLGVTWRLTSAITAFTAPFFFRDEQVKGPFRWFQHEHQFLQVGSSTFMEDLFKFELPCGKVGELIGSKRIADHLQKLLSHRNSVIKRAAESEEWMKYLMNETACDAERSGSGHLSTDPRS